MTVTERSTEWIATAPITINVQAELAANPQAVWAHFAECETWTEWFPGFKACNYISHEPHGLNSIRFVHQDQFKVEEKITEWEPGRRWGMTVVDINIGLIRSMAEHVEITPFGSGSSVDFTIGVELAPWARPAAPLLKRKSERQLRQALQQLDERCARTTRTTG